MIRLRTAAPARDALGAPVPGEYQVLPTPLTPKECRDGSFTFYDRNTLCCLRLGARYKCHRVREAEAPKDEGFCLEALQIYLMRQGRLLPASVTGQWNAETEEGLRSRFPNPRATPGGSCAMLTMLGIEPEPEEPTWFEKETGGVPRGALLGAGVALAALLVYALLPPTPGAQA